MADRAVGRLHPVRARLGASSWSTSAPGLLRAVARAPRDRAARRAGQPARGARPSEGSGERAALPVAARARTGTLSPSVTSSPRRRRSALPGCGRGAGQRSAGRRGARSRSARDRRPCCSRCNRASTPTTTGCCRSTWCSTCCCCWSRRCCCSAADPCCSPCGRFRRAADRWRAATLARPARARGPARLPCRRSRWCSSRTHLPAFYDATLRHPALHDLEHALYLVAGLLLWSPLLDGDPAPRAPARRSGPARLPARGDAADGADRRLSEPARRRSSTRPTGRPRARSASRR